METQNIRQLLEAFVVILAGVLAAVGAHLWQAMNHIP